MATYLEKNALFQKLIDEPAPKNLGMVIVIPCYNETELIKTLRSIKNCNAANCFTEVIVVVNDGERTTDEIKAQNLTTFEKATTWAKENITLQHLQFHIIYKSNLPKKIAGVGTARKIGMDEAVRRLESVGKSEGVIICFDADSLCEVNYFEAIISHFKKHPKTPGCSIHFEHPLEGNCHTVEEYNAIISYELHLRYYKNAQQYTGLPFVFHTIGSSMAVRAEAYAKQGGMNKRKAGEDFYFLNKIIQLGNFTELNHTTVIPSPRVSDRVPFGTGKAVGEIVSAEQGGLETYSFRTFVELKEFVSEVYENNKNINTSKLSGLINQFIEERDLSLKIDEIAKNANSEEAFITRFFKVFDAFWIMKYVHFARDNFHKQVSVLAASNELLLELGVIDQPLKTELEALIKFRSLDKNRVV